MIWPSEMLERAKQMWADGYSGSLIGAEIGKTRNAVLGKAHRMGWSARGPDSPLKGLRRKRRGRESDPIFSFDASGLPVMRPKSVSRPGRNVKFNKYPSHRVRPETKPVEIMPVEPSPESAVMLMSLTPRSCRWPVGEAVGRDQKFCGGGKEFEQSYCAWHRLKAYGIGTPSERLAHEVAA